MITIRIGNDSRRLEDVEESWIAQEIGNRQRANLPLCVEVTIETGSLNFKLATPSCGPSSGARRAPRPDEAEIIKLWTRSKLGSDDFSGGNVIAFIKQLRRLL